MCLEDIRLGRQLGTQASIVSVVTGAARDLVPPDVWRTRLTFSSDGTGTLHLGCEGITPAAGQGFTLTPTNPVITIRVEEWGKLVQGRWQAFAAAGTILVAVAQSTLEKA